MVSEINNIVSSIAAAEEEQPATTREIAENITFASTGVSQVNENVAQGSSGIRHFLWETGRLKRQKGGADQLMPLAPAITINPLHNLISRKIANGQDMVDAFNKGLKMIQEDGSYDAILKKHGF